MPKPIPINTTDNDTHALSQHEDIYQVVLYNDDHNAADYVALCLMRVFKHNMTMAVKIMYEAHTTGKAIAEVEAKPEAILHKQQLESAGLTAEVEKV